MKKIARDDYLRHALSLNEREVWSIEQLAPWLPSQIIDCHAHSNLEEHFQSINEQAYTHMLSTFPYFSIAESKKIQKLFYPLTTVRSLRFPKTFKGINHREANKYLLSFSPPEDRVAIYGLPDDIEYTCTELEHERVSALKMYYSYFTPPATDVYQYFPKEILQVAEKLGIPIILHPPTAITKCWEQVIRLKDDFPTLKISLAHLGLTKVVLPELEKVYQKLASETDIYLDTALNPSAEVVGLALGTFGHDRIMFGSDEPLNLIRSKVYINPELGERLITDYPYHWVNKKEHETYKGIATDMAHCHWDCLFAIKHAVAKFSPENEVAAKNAIFYDNAKQFFGF